MFKKILLISCLIFICSCSSKKEILYLQDAEQYNNKEISYSSAALQPNDVLQIKVGALISESALPYNRAPSAVPGASVELMQLDGYLVSENLTINFPILGQLSVSNMSSQQFATFLKKKLEDDGHLKNPTVDVRLINAKVTVLGQVNRPGTFNFTEQNITLLQALGYAGDLTINGKREDVILMREEKGIRQITHIDLTSAAWLEGPYNFIKPNDVIIVNPNNPKVKSAGFIGNTATVISVVSILLTSIVLITR